MTIETDYKLYSDVAIPGMISGLGNPQVLPFVNRVGATLETWTITPPATPDANADYKLTIAGLMVKFRTGDSTTTAQLGTGLYNAIRSSPEVFRLIDATLNGTTGVITLKSRFLNTPFTPTVNAGETTADLVAAKTVSAGSVAAIPFGRFVGRKSAYEFNNSYVNTSPLPVGECSLIDSAAAFSGGGYNVLGITMSTHAIERKDYGPAMKNAEYQSLDILNVLTHTNDIKGIWVECVEADITSNDPCYIAVGTGNQGKASKTASGNVNASTYAQFVSPAIQSVGYNLVLVQFRRPGIAA